MELTGVTWENHFEVRDR